MKIKLDENLPGELVDLFAAQGHDVHTVHGESLVGRDDEDIFEASIREGRLLLTQDMDFSDTRKFKPGTHPGVVLLRLHQPSRRKLLERIRQILQPEAIETWDGCFVVISDRKLRVRRA
jgi:predicted nuclease of predicted toxin-antitoxin system